MTCKVTKRAIATSILALSASVSMLIGTTFAWFTDSVSSNGNIIKTGRLDVEMKWTDGTDNPVPDNTWKSPGSGEIFNYSLWEPGYTEARHIAISNEGSLGLKYKVLFQAEAGTIDMDLAGTIDVFYSDPAKQMINRSSVDGLDHIGTLADVLQNNAGDSNTAQGELLPGQQDVVTVVLKMQESAGNEYQNRSIGDSFSIKIFASQLAYESDSFNNTYDKDALYEDEVLTSSDMDYTSENGKITVTVPAGSAYVFDKFGITATYDVYNNGDGSCLISTEIRFTKNDQPVTDGSVSYPVKINIGTGLRITSVTHAGSPVAYTYDQELGTVGFTTNGFSLFEINYTLGQIEDAEED